MTEWQWHQLDHMQIIFTSLHTDNHASTSPLTFYKLDALPAAQPTASIKKALKAQSGQSNLIKRPHRRCTWMVQWYLPCTASVQPT